MKFLKNIYNNVNWFFTEVIKMYSSQKSFFSKKRFESGVAFFISQLGMVFFLIKKIDSMDMYEMSIWAGLEFLIAGYTVNQIQKEKIVKTVNNDGDTSEESEESAGKQILND